MKTFDQIHEEGSQKYGLLWLETNRVATQIADAYHVDITQDKMKLLLSSLCLGFLNRILSVEMEKQDANNK